MIVLIFVFAYLTCLSMREIFRDLRAAPGYAGH